MIKIAIIDDNKAFLKVLELLLSNIQETTGFLDLSMFSSPLDFKQSNTIFDIVVLDCIFKLFPSEVNGIKLAEHAKRVNPKVKIILISEFMKTDFLPILNQYSSNIDFFANKDADSNNIVKKIKEYAEELKLEDNAKIAKVVFKFHIYKHGKEDIPFLDIDYARVKERDKHLISIQTSSGEKILSATLSSFLTNVNNKFAKKGIKRKEEKNATDLYVNILNIEKIEKDRIIFKSKNELDISNVKGFHI